MEADKKLLFFDIDGTLAWPGNPPSGKTVEALQKARQNGHKIFISTGRGTRGIDPPVKAIGFDGYIFHAGSRAVVDDKVVVDQYVETEKWQEAAAIIEDLVVTYVVDCDTVAYKNRYYTREYLLDKYEEIPEWMLRILSNDRDPLLDKYCGEPVYKMVIVTESLSKMQEVRKRLEGIAKVTSYENFSPGLGMIHADITFVEYSKGSAMKAICKKLGMDVKDCIAFGDGINDLEILQTAGVGVAMGNADEEVKQIADRICEACLEDGIAKELDRMGLL